MDIPEFSIPLRREDLCEAREGQYYVTHFYSVKELNERLEAARSSFHEDGPFFIVGHFSTFYSVFQQFKHLTDLHCQKVWSIITRAMAENSTKLLVLFDDIKNVDSNLRNDMRNVTKMICYALFELMGLLQDKYGTQNNLMDAKAKKKPKLSSNEWDWTEEKHKMLNEIYAFIQLPIKLVWDPPVVDDEFVNLVANFCYKCLEDPGISNPKTKCLRETIFQIFGILIKNYLHGLSFCVKIVQLLKSYEHLVSPLAKGTVQLIKECQCTNIAKEIVREISDTDGDQLVADTSGTRSINQFLVQLAESVPETMIPATDLLLQHLAGDSYTMRMCVLEVLGEIVLTILSGENLSEDLKKLRDEFLDCLQEHIHDVNAFVRSKVLQVWQKLCSVQAIPISRFNQLLELTIGRLNDKSANVKKHAIHLVKDLLERNPYSAQLNSEDIQNQLTEEVEKLELLKKAHNIVIGDVEWQKIEPKLEEIVDMLETGIVDSSEKDEDLNLEEKIDEIGNYITSGEYKRAVEELVYLKNKCDTHFNLEGENENLVALLRHIFDQKVKGILVSVPFEVREQIDKHKSAIDYLENSLKFAELIDLALPIILSLLDSSVITDVLESSQFFTAAYLFGFNRALEGVRKMLYLMYSKEDAVKSAVSDAYEKIYFEKNSSGRHRYILTIKNLSDLILKLNDSQLNALELVVRQWLQGGLIDSNFIHVMFERFSKKIANTSEAYSWASLVLIRMVGSEESRIIKNNISVLLSQGLCKAESCSFLVAKETCTALMKLIQPGKDGKTVDPTLRYSSDHEIFIILHKFLRDGLWRTDDPHYTPMADEAINLVFLLSDKPDAFCEKLISEIHEWITNNIDPWKKRENKTGKHLMQESGMNDLLDEKETQPDPGESKMDNIITEEDGYEKDILLLTRFISILGQIAANYLLFLEGPVLNELKKRNQLDFDRRLKRFQEKKNRSLKEKKNLDASKSEQESEDLEFNRVAADDMDAEEMKKATEKEIVTGSGYFAKFAPLILTVCKNPGKYNSGSLQNASLITLSKFMMVSSVFCEENLQLLVTICGKSHCPEQRKNAIIALGALQYRFPNTLEPWTPNMYAVLKDSDSEVRLTAVMMLTDLILNEMIKVRTNISDLALCIVDKDSSIAKTVRHFFREYSLKGNSLFNVLPSLISNLIRPDSELTHEEFRTITKFILELFTKDKQSEHLIDKLFQYFESATTERQWSDLSFCLSQLNYNEKGLKKVLENLRIFGSKLYLSDVYEAFNVIVTNAKKNPQKDKALLNEIQDLIKECRDKFCQDKNVSFTARKVNNMLSTVKRTTGKELRSSKREQLMAKRGSVKCKREIKYEDDENDDAFMSDCSTKKNHKSHIGKNKISPIENISDDEIENREYPKKETKKVKTEPQTKRIKSKGKYSDYTSEEEDMGRVLRSNRKRK